MLASFDASSMQTMPNDAGTGTVFTFDVSDNDGNTSTASSPYNLGEKTGLKGSYVATSATTSETFRQNSLMTLKPYATLVIAAATATTPTVKGLGSTKGDDTFLKLNYYKAATATETATQAVIDTKLKLAALTAE